MPVQLAWGRSASYENLMVACAYGALSLNGLTVVVHLQQEAGHLAALCGPASLATMLLITPGSRAGALCSRLSPRFFICGALASVGI